MTELVKVESKTLLNNKIKTKNVTKTNRGIERKILFYSCAIQTLINFVAYQYQNLYLTSNWIQKIDIYFLSLTLILIEVFHFAIKYSNPGKICHAITINNFKYLQTDIYKNLLDKLKKLDITGQFESIHNFFNFNTSPNLQKYDKISVLFDNFKMLENENIITKNQILENLIHYSYKKEVLKSMQWDKIKNPNEFYQMMNKNIVLLSIIRLFTNIETINLKQLIEFSMCEKFPISCDSNDSIQFLEISKLSDKQIDLANSMHILLEQHKNFCEQCQLELTNSETFHCHICGQCVEQNDHHCVFLDNCIGIYNYFYFGIQLLLNIVYQFAFIVLWTIDIQTNYFNPLDIYDIEFLAKSMFLCFNVFIECLIILNLNFVIISLKECNSQRNQFLNKKSKRTQFGIFDKLKLQYDNQDLTKSSKPDITLNRITIGDNEKDLLQKFYENVMIEQ